MKMDTTSRLRIWKDCNGGFVVKFLGKYRNLGYMDPKTSRKNPSEEVSIPATSDNVFDKVRSKVGKNATYMPEEMRKVEAEQVKYGSSAYTKDYENLNLQGYIEIDYDCEVSDGGLTELANFIKAPATENTNNKMIHNDDSIPSGGDFANSKEDVSPEDPDVEHTKSVQEKSYKAGDTLHYETISDENGSWYIDRIMPANYKLTVHAPDGMMLTRAANRNGGTSSSSTRSTRPPTTGPSSSGSSPWAGRPWTSTSTPGP